MSSSLPLPSMKAADLAAAKQKTSFDVMPGSVNVQNPEELGEGSIKGYVSFTGNFDVSDQIFMKQQDNAQRRKAEEQEKEDRERLMAFRIASTKAAQASTPALMIPPKSTSKESSLPTIGARLNVKISAKRKSSSSSDKGGKKKTKGEEGKEEKEDKVLAKEEEESKTKEEVAPPPSMTSLLPYSSDSDDDD